MPSPRLRRSLPRKSAARRDASGDARDRMAARGSERIADAIEELILELPARVRGSRARLSEQALGIVRALVDDLNLVTRDELEEVATNAAKSATSNPTHARS